jgi:hypothetical protein
MPERRYTECPCGRNISTQNRRAHAGSCAHARNAGWEAPPEKTDTCLCGCGGVAVSRGAKRPRFVDNKHYDRWRRQQPAVQEQHREAQARWRHDGPKKRRTLGEAVADTETRAMAAIRAREAEALAEYRRGNTAPTMWDAARILDFYLSFKATPTNEDIAAERCGYPPQQHGAAGG